MDERLQGTTETQRGKRRWQRGWIPYDRYIAIHDSHIDDLSTQGYVQRDTITFLNQRNNDGSLRAVIVQGRIVCSDDVAIRVHKVLAVRRGRGNRTEVLTIEYSYHAWVRGRPRRDLFRYDNAHDALHTLHRHDYDAEGNEIGQTPVSGDEMPRLDLVIKMAVDLARG